METNIVNVIVNTNRNIRKPWQSRIVISSFLFLGYYLWGIVGVILALIGAVLFVMWLNSMRCVKMWNLCERDYAQLVSGGFSEDKALFALSKSFNPTLSDSFHKQVTAKFRTLNDVVIFFTGALPENVNDEEWAIDCLEKTTIKRSIGGSYRACTKH